MAARTRTLTLRPSAKINLGLHVGPQRSDGFHDLRTLFVSIDVSDRLTMTLRRGPFTLGVSDPSLSAGRDNLIYRAAELLWRDAGRRGDPSDVALSLTKRIPMAAGLGGGSTDAAATLAGLNKLWRLGRSRQQLMALAARIGSDVPFFLVGGAALAMGRGEELYPAADVSRVPLLVVTPDFGVGTADAYGWLDEDRGRTPSREAPADHADSLDVGWPTGPISLSNDLEDPVIRRCPEIGDILLACRLAGAQAAAMSGSGSAVFAVFPSKLLAKAERSLKRPGWRVIRTRMLSRREVSRRMSL